LSEFAEIEYKCTDFYDPTDELRIIWNDPSIGIKWPVSNPIVSAKDRSAKTLAEQFDLLPTFGDAST
jgi:dTDP-4-dehydrorhamnose 3,5-epimerase